MAYSEAVAERVRDVLEGHPYIEECKMFGGMAFLVNGNMSAGVLDDMLVLRLGEKGAAEALKKPHTEPMTFTGKVIKSMVYVLPDGFKSDKDLAHWVMLSVDFALTLPEK